MTPGRTLRATAPGTWQCSSLARARPEGAAVKLHFTPSDGPPSLTLLSVLVRAEADELGRQRGLHRAI